MGYQNNSDAYLFDATKKPQFAGLPPIRLFPRLSLLLCAVLEHQLLALLEHISDLR